MALAVAVAGCGPRSLDAGPRDAAGGVRLDGALAAADVVARDAVTAAELIPITADAVAAYDSGSCPVYRYERYEIACFGSDPGPYEKYLRPRDGGVAPGLCPGVGDFGGSISEGECAWLACGPLTANGVANLADAGITRGDDGGSGAGAACCYLARYVCGV